MGSSLNPKPWLLTSKPSPARCEWCGIGASGKNKAAVVAWFRITLYRLQKGLIETDQKKGCYRVSIGVP